MSHITSVHARQIVDSRGNPTIEVDVFLDKQRFRAAVPSGASTGIHEALELRDQDSSAYFGKGVLKAVSNVNNVIGPKLIAARLDVCDQRAVDAFLIALDGTASKSKLGANAILGVSMAVCRAGAYVKGVPLYRHIANLAGIQTVTLPCPAFNVINGGAHASNPIAFQEFMVLPTGATSFSEAMQIGAEVYQSLKRLLVSQYKQGIQVGDEGGFAPNFDSPVTVLRVIQEAVAAAGHQDKCHFALDVAASEFYVDGKYDLDVKDKAATGTHRILTGLQMVQEYKNLKQACPKLISIEDPFEQDDWSSWTELTSSLGIQIVGDDLTVTNPIRIAQAIAEGACNALLLKINQIGTITESIDAALLVKSKGWNVMVSHRSGETEDTFIADLAVGLAAGQIKTGAPCRSERLAKYNQLLRIEEELGDAAIYSPPKF